MFERFTTEARDVVVLAQLSARQLGHDYIGTEHILLGLLQQPDAVSGRVLIRHGLTHDTAVAAIRRFAGPSDDLDADALATIGIDLDAVRQKVEAAFGPGALDPRGRRRPQRGVVGGHIPFTARAKKVLELSLREAVRLRHNFIGSGHLLLGLLREGEGLAAKVIADTGADFDDLRREITVEFDNP